MFPRIDLAEDPLSIILGDVDVVVSAVRDVVGAQEAAQACPLSVPGFVAVIEGDCRCQSAGGNAVDLHAGDLLFLIHGGPYHVHSHGDSGIQPLREPAGKLAGPSTDSLRLISGALRLAEQCHAMICTVVPEVFHLPYDCDDLDRGTSWVRHFVEECSSTTPGSSAIRDQLARMAVCTAVRQRIRQQEFPSVGIARALTDADLGPIIAAIHRSPDRPWTIEALASIACLSRTTFIQRFRLLAGVPVMEYVTDYRMRCAAELLITSRLQLKEIASRIGYRSLSAFGTAFKRWSGTAPDVFRRDLNAVATRILETIAPPGCSAASANVPSRGPPSPVSAESDRPIES